MPLVSVFHLRVRRLRGSFNIDHATNGSAKRAIMDGFRAAWELPFSLTGRRMAASAQMPGLPVL